MSAVERSVSARQKVAIALAVAAIAVVAAIIVVRRDDKAPVDRTASSAASTTGTSTSSTTTSTTVAAAPVAIWPFDSAPRRFATPEQAALSFAVEYLGMTNATAIHSTTAGGHTAVQVRPSATGGPITDIGTAPRGDSFIVVGARSDSVTIDRPFAQDGLSHPLVVAGNSTAFEATITIELRAFGAASPLVQQSAMGGSNGEIGPYGVTLDVPAATTSGVLIAAVPDVSDRGAVLAASVIALGAPSSGSIDGSPDIVAKTDHGTFVVIEVATGAQRESTGSPSPVETPMDFNRVVGQLAYGDRDFGDQGGSCQRSVYVFLLDGTPFRTLRAADHPAFRGDGGMAFVACDGSVFAGQASPAHEYIVRNDKPAVDVTWADANRLVIDYGTGELFLAVLDTPNPGTTVLTKGTLPAGRGGFHTVAFYDGDVFSSVDPLSGTVTKLVKPAAAPVSLDADEHGALLWVDANDDLWTWSGGDPVKVGTGFTSAAW